MQLKEKTKVVTFRLPVEYANEIRARKGYSKKLRDLAIQYLKNDLLCNTDPMIKGSAEVQP